MPWQVSFCVRITVAVCLKVGLVDPLKGTNGLWRWQRAKAPKDILSDHIARDAGQQCRIPDVRIDDHQEPVAEIRRLMAVPEERYLLFREAMGAVVNVSGMRDRTALDKAIAENEIKRAAAVTVSHSLAAPLTT